MRSRKIVRSIIFVRFDCLLIRKSLGTNLVISAVSVNNRKIIHQWLFCWWFCLCVSVYYNRFYVCDVCKFCCFAVERSMFSNSMTVCARPSYVSQHHDSSTAIGENGKPRANLSKTQRRTYVSAKLVLFDKLNWFIFRMDFHPLFASFLFCLVGLYVLHVYTHIYCRSKIDGQPVIRPSNQPTIHTSSHLIIHCPHVRSSDRTHAECMISISISL